MDPDKAPGPDGMTPAFYQKYWSIVGLDVVRLTQIFFQSGELSDGINDTNVVLIPKKKESGHCGRFKTNILMQRID